MQMIVSDDILGVLFLKLTFGSQSLLMTQLSRQQLPADPSPYVPPTSWQYVHMTISWVTDGPNDQKLEGNTATDQGVDNVMSVSVIKWRKKEVKRDYLILNLRIPNLPAWALVPPVKVHATHVDKGYTGTDISPFLSYVYSH